GLVIHKTDNNPPIRIEKYSLLDWYKLTEATRHILNSVITQSGRLQMEEMEKENPDEYRIGQLQELSRKAVEISRDSKIFENKRRMLGIIETFGNIEIS